MNWLLLILTLPTDNSSARMRAWRGLKAAGAVVLRDGVYLLPAGDARQQVLAEIAQAVEGSSGTAWLLETGSGEYDFTPLFDRTEDYRRIAEDIDKLLEQPLHAGEHHRQARKLRRAFEVIHAIDFFPAEAGRQTAALLQTLEGRLLAESSDHEPSPSAGDIPHLDKAEYQGRRWATRARPWVDRLASAWLIRRHIDPTAQFIWLATPADCPPDALGFDFDGARFTHVGERVSFETLLASFGLESDPALMRLARVVHALDVGGLPVAEAAGLEALLAGMRARLTDDDALLDAASAALDYFHAALKETP